MKKLEKFNDMDIVTLDELEDVPGPRKMKKWKKVLLIALAVVFAIIALVIATFFFMQSKGEKNLKTKVSNASTEAGRKEGHYIIHNGKEYKYREDIVNILCLGIDKDIPMEEKRETGSLGLADAILLVSIDTDRNTLQIISIPRDVILPVTITDDQGNEAGTEEKQLTYQYAYGRTTEQSGKLMVDTVSELLYRVPIQRYCAVNFQAIPLLNDAIGGVDLTVLESLEWYAGEFIQGTEIHLEGQMALDYVRQRNESVEGSNLGRMERQKQYITAFLQKAKTVVSQDLTLPVTMYQQLQANMSTDVKAEDITYLVPELLEIPLEETNMLQIPGESRMGEVYEEYHVNKEELKNLVINTFYEEVKDSGEKATEPEDTTTQNETSDKGEKE